MILLVDNYDSFSYNLYQLIGSINTDIKVIRNDECTLEEIDQMKPEYIIISPGPGKPNEAGMIEEIIDTFKGKYPILGVCLGHQAICEVFGATVTYAKELMHGKSSVVTIKDDPIFKGLNNKIKVARYHSLIAKKDTIPECLEVIAETDDHEVMAIRHREYPIYGLQFHPESILTEDGYTMMNNILKGE